MSLYEIHVRHTLTSYMYLLGRSTTVLQVKDTRGSKMPVGGYERVEMDVMMMGRMWLQKTRGLRFAEGQKEKRRSSHDVMRAMRTPIDLHSNTS
jgi:hypothetical protein